MDAIRLYVDRQFASPYAMSAFVALCEKEVPFEVVTVDLEAGEQRGAEFAGRSLTGRVPVLQQGDFSLSESSAIAEYVDEVFPGARLYPTDRMHRARARQVQAWLRSDLMPLRQERSTEVIFCGKRGGPLSAAAQDAAAKLCSVAEALLAPEAEHLFGEWGIADVDLALMLNRLVLHGDAVPARLAAYATRQWKRPSVQRWVKQARPPL